MAATTPRMTAPRCRRATSTAATRMPAVAISGGPAVRSPSPIPVAGLLTTTPASRRPTSVMNRPMPTPIASLSDIGTASMIAVRRPVSTRITAITASMTTTARPTCHGRSRPRMMSKATMALTPRPGASANGRLVASAIAAVVTAAASAVHTITHPAARRRRQDRRVDEDDVVIVSTLRRRRAPRCAGWSRAHGRRKRRARKLDGSRVRGGGAHGGANVPAVPADPVLVESDHR